MMIALILVSFSSGDSGYLALAQAPWQKVAVYLVLMAAAAALSILILTVDDLPVPNVLGPLDGCWGNYGREVRPSEGDCPGQAGYGPGNPFVVGNTLVFALGGRAGPDIWLAFLVAIAVTAPFILIFARLTSLMHGKTFADGVEMLFGKWPSRAVALLYTGYAWRLGCLVVSHVTHFIQAVSLPTTPQTVMSLAFGVLVIWIVKGGIEVLARFSSVMSRVVLTVLFSAFALLINRVDLGQFLPVMYNGFGPVMEGALQLLDFPFMETVLLFWIFDGFKKKDSAYRVFVPGFLVALILLIMDCTSLVVLGADRYGIFYFPIYTSIARIDVSTFLTPGGHRASPLWASFVKIAVCLLAASKTLAYALGFDDYRFLVTSLVLAPCRPALFIATRWK